MPRPKRKISAKAVARDVIAGADDSALMTKYRLAPQGLDLLFKELLQAKVITDVDLAMREFSGVGVPCSQCGAINPSYNKFCGQCREVLSRSCPACGATVPSSVRHCAGCAALATSPARERRELFVEKTRMAQQGRKIVLNRLLRDIRAGFGHTALLSKYNLSPRKLSDLFNTLLASGVITGSELDRLSRSRSRNICPKCACFNYSQNVYCGQCGHQLRELPSHLEKPLPVHEGGSPELPLRTEQVLQAEGATSQSQPQPRDDVRLVEEIKRAVSTVLTPLRKFTRSKKAINRAFYFACSAGQSNKVLSLLDAGAEIDGDDEVLQHGTKGRFEDVWLHPLGIAAKNGHHDVVKLLLNKGAVPDRRGGFALTTALMETRSIAVATLLLEHGADINAADLGGLTALMFNASDGCLDMVRFLLSRGANVNALNAAGDTALMCAAQYTPLGKNDPQPSFIRDYPGVLRELLAHGADLSVRNREGFTALALADDCYHEELAHILREAGASEPTVEIDSEVLAAIIAMFRKVLDDSGRFSSGLHLDVNNARKSVRLSIALMFLSVSMLGKLAYIDGRPRRAELSSLRRFVFGSGWNNWLEAAEIIFHMAGRAPNHNNMALKAFKIDANAFARLFRNHRASVKTVGDELLLMATADGPINYLERQLLDLFSAKVGWTRSSDRYENFDSEREPGDEGDDIDSCYVMLKCSQEDSDTHIRNLYRQLAKEYHPDTIQGKGLPEDFLSFANRRFQEIQECYQRIMDHRRKRPSH